MSSFLTDMKIAVHPFAPHYSFLPNLLTFRQWGREWLVLFCFVLRRRKIKGGEGESNHKNKREVAPAIVSGRKNEEVMLSTSSIFFFLKRRDTIEASQHVLFLNMMVMQVVCGYLSVFTL